MAGHGGPFVVAGSTGRRAILPRSATTSGELKQDEKYKEKTNHALLLRGPRRASPGHNCLRCKCRSSIKKKQQVFFSREFLANRWSSGLSLPGCGSLVYCIRGFAEASGPAA